MSNNARINRMARRLGQARSALEHETRRTETIVAEAATGVPRSAAIHRPFQLSLPPTLGSP